jgi:hypothetical protein
MHEEVATKQDLREEKKDIIIKLGGMMIAGFMSTITIILTVLPLLINK